MSLWTNVSDVEHLSHILLERTIQILSLFLIFSGAVGLTKFRDGIKTVDSAEEKFSNLKKDVVSYLRSAIQLL